MAATTVLEPGGPTATAAPERLSFFQRIADRVSYAMGTPTNIGVWIVLVVGWTLLFAFGGPSIASGSFLPHWFTSTGFNFPLNLVTTVAELYIGFLVGASSNRSERNLEATLGRLGEQDQQIDDVEQRLAASLGQNIQLTREIHELTALIHQTVCGPK
jgi:low affinity Fe/Cu permease